MSKFAIHGTTDEITVCACCGKKNLRNTVVLEVIEGDNAGDLLHFGSHCAARAMGKAKNRADIILDQAKRIQSLSPVVAIVKLHISRGIEIARDEARAFAKANKLDILINGYESWGQINIHGNNATVTVAA